RYYTESAGGYKFFHNRDGSIHMSLTASGSTSASNSRGQADIVQQHVEALHARSVLELGCGKGFNLAHLARLNLDANFVGIDLTPGHISTGTKKYVALKNLRLIVQDFETLPFDDAAFDLLFEVEAVCHSQNPRQVFAQAYRVLRPGGRFIVFDGFR